MATPDLDVIKDIPGYKVILKAVVRSQIQQLVEQLATHTEEESIILTASVADGTLSHIGSASGKSFLEDNEDVKSQFLGFCLKYHHRKKQEEKEKERERQIQEQLQQQQKMQQMLSAAAASYNAPRPRFMPTRSPRQHSPRYQSHMGRGMSPRHEPYPISRPMRRPTPLNLEGGAPRFPAASNDGRIIKIEPDNNDETSNQSANDNTTGDGSTQPTTPSNVQSGDNDDAKSESSNSTVPNVPPDGLSLESDLSNLISSGDAPNSEELSGTTNPEQPGTSSAPQTPGGGSDTDANVSIKLEAMTEAEMELEITGVEPGRPMLPVPQDDWGANMPIGMNFDPSGGATGSMLDMSPSQQGYNVGRVGVLNPRNIHGNDLSAAPMTEEEQMFRAKFCCEICGRHFVSSWHVKRHMRMHTGEKPYKCDACGRSFSQKQNLLTHKLSHLPANLYK